MAIFSVRQVKLDAGVDSSKSIQQAVFEQQQAVVWV